MLKPTPALGSLLCGALLLAAPSCTDLAMPADDLAAAPDGADDPDGPFSITVSTPSGPRDMTVVADADGNLIAEGDIVVMTAAQRRQRSTVMQDLGTRWPSGQVPYAISSSITGALRTAIEDGLDHIEAHTPIRFVAHNWQTNYINFVPSAYNRSPIGLQGGRQDIEMKSDSAAVAAHEVMHSLGFFHEQSRSDRDTYVAIHPDCINDDDEHNYDRADSDDEDHFGPYDFGSVMHYGSSDFCVKNASGACACLPMTRISGTCATCVDGDGTGTAETIYSQRDNLSVGDVNGIHLAYGGGIDSNEISDNFGAATVSGDFDRDGYPDLAVGTPEETAGSDPAAGAVHLYKGTAWGLVGWRVLTQETVGVTMTGGSTPALGVNETFDGFGGALAVGDFNGDGTDDLAVGAAGQDAGAALNAGAVFVFLGNPVRSPADDRGNLQPWQVITQASLGLDVNEGADEFGAALAAGDVNGDGRDDLLIGAPGDSPGTSPAGGAAYLARGTATSLAPWARLTSSNPIRAYERFGRAVAIGDTDGDGKAELAIGAPDEVREGLLNVGGAVFVYRGTATGNPTVWTSFLLEGTKLATADYGAAITAGDLDGDGRVELAIGAPNLAGGRVYVYRGVAAAPPSEATRQILSQSVADLDEAGDQFGSSIAIGDLQVGGPALVIGAPGEDEGATDVGRTYVFRKLASSTAISWWAAFDMTGIGTMATLDRLGTAVAIVPRSADGAWSASYVAGSPGYASGGRARSGALGVVKYQSGLGLRAVDRLDQEVFAPFR